MSHPTLAAIDIGSNSIRLVVYRLMDGIWQTLINEKSAVRLGEGVAASGQIHPKKITLALENLQRFKQLCDLADVDGLTAIATSAVREAENGPGFAQAASAILGSTLRVLSGPQEAEYAAAGVRWAIPDASGLVCDLGGSSLEIIPIIGQETPHEQSKHAISLDIGPLRLFDLFGDNHKKAKAYIDHHIKSAVHSISQSYGPIEGRRIYSVGGAWRALGLLHMRRNQHPLSMVHRYSPRFRNFLAYNKSISQMNRDKAMSLEVSQIERRISLPYAALILRRLIKWTRAEALEFCSVGVREGALSKQAEQTVPGAIRQSALQGIRQMVVNGGRFGPIGDPMIALVSKAYLAKIGQMHTLSYDRLVESCHLADFGWDAIPTHKKLQTYTSILNNAVLPHSHDQRIILAAVQYYRHKGRSADVTAQQFGRLLKSKEHKAVRTLGRLLRLFMQISRGQPKLLEQMNLELHGDQMAVTFPDSWHPEHAAGVKAACDMLTDACGLKVKLKAVDDQKQSTKAKVS